MGRPKKENIVKTEEEIQREDKLRELEHEVIRHVVIAIKSTKLSQRVVGERAGIIRETVAKIENNLNSVTPSCKKINVSRIVSTVLDLSIGTTLLISPI